MKQHTFDQMMETGEFEKMFNENKINELLNSGELTKKQIDALVKLGQKMSKQELQKRQNDLAAQPGYREHILTPLIKKIIAEQGRVRDPKTGRYMKKDAPVVDEPPKPSKETEQTAEKVGSTLKKTKKEKEKVENTTSQNANETKDVKKSKKKTAKDVLAVPKMQVNKALYTTVAQRATRLKKGDSAANIAAKIFMLLHRNADTRKLTTDTEETRAEKAKSQNSKTYKKEEKTPKKNEGNLFKYAILATVGGAGLLYFIENMNKFTGIEEMQKKLKSFTENIMKDFENSSIVKEIEKALNSVKKAVTGESGIPKQELKDLIASKESGGDYKKFVGMKEGKKVPEKYKDTDITKMTLAEVSDLQKGMIKDGFQSSALGKYQTLEETLRNTARSLGMDPKTTKYTPEVQEQIADKLLINAGIEDYKSGKMSEDDFINKIAGVWAAFPVSKDITRIDKAGIKTEIKEGQSYHSGIGTNKALIPLPKARDAVRGLLKPPETTTPTPVVREHGAALDTASIPIADENLAKVLVIQQPIINNTTTIVNSLPQPGQSGTSNIRFPKPSATN